MTSHHLTPAALIAALALLAGCDGGGRVTDLAATAPALPPAPTSSAAAATPVTATPSPVVVPTPSGIALAQGRAAPRTAAPVGAPTAGDKVAAAAPADSICAGLRGPDLDACIDAAARASADPVAVDEDAERAFREDQARRDQALMDDEANDARLAQGQDDARDRDARDLDARDREARDREARDREARDHEEWDREARQSRMDPRDARTDDGDADLPVDPPLDEDDDRRDPRLDDEAPYPPPPDDGPYPQR